MADTNRTVHRIESIVLVAIGGFAGANLRYFVDGLLGGPPGTLAVNALGSLALGFLLYEARYTATIPRRTRIVVGTGFLSSLTTYSTFALEAVGFGVLGVGYVVASYGFGFAGVVLGRWLARGFEEGVS